MESLRRINTLSAAAVLALILMVGTSSTSASARAPRMTFTTITTTSLTGKVKWQIDVSLDSVSRVDFYIDGALRWTEFTSPYQFNGDPNGMLDTTTLSNGKHTLSAQAQAAGTSHTVSASLDVSVSNSTPSITPISPAVTTPPSISGTPVVGSQLTTSAGAWSGTQPISLSFKWQRCVNTTCLAIAGATGSSYTAASADVGDTLRVTATGTNVAGTYSVDSAPTGLVANATGSPPPPPPPPPPPSSTPSFPALPVRPAFSPKRTIYVTTQSQFLAALSNLQPGDLVNVSPMTLTGEIVIRASLADYAEIDFASGVHFTGAAVGSKLPSVWVVGTSKLRLFGGEITGNGNDGLRIEDSSYVTWQGFTIHDTAGTGLYVHGISRGTDHLDLYGEIYHCGWDYLNLDPHAEKGTGIHAAYLGGGNLPTTTSSFVLDIHDQTVGSAVEAGSMLQNSDLWIRAKRITFVATQQVAGNAIQGWGDQNQKNRVHYLEAEDVTRAVEGDGLYSATTSDAFTIEYARTLRSRLSPYPVYRGIIYGNVG